MSRSLQIFRSTWGMIKEAEGPMELPAFLKKIKQEGLYTGIEIPLVFALQMGPDKFSDLMKENDFKVIFQIFGDAEVYPGHPVHQGRFAGFPEPNCHDIPTSILGFQKSVEASMGFGDLVAKVNSHSIRDWNTSAEACEFFDAVLPWQKQFDKLVMHETHRKRYLHSPWVCRDFVDHYGDELRMVADLSHFTCVAEVPPQNAELTDVIRKIAPRVDHIHARYGFDHGPQVPDPRAPYWQSYIEGFEAWWDMIWEEQLANPNCVPTLTPEHGPPNYQWVDPRDGQPCADIIDVNAWIAQRMKDRFEAIHGNAK